tara:strand:- start:1025 stop:1654 length:630 start_codon:yes stop_codon:yes gene_type:complete
MDYNILKIRVLSSVVIILLILFFLTFGSNYLWLLFLVLYSIFIYEINNNFINNKNKFFIYLYILMSLIFLQLYLFYYFLTMDFIIIILTITIFDTSSYLLGSLIGRTKILSISPNKTYEGLLGGIIFTIIFMIIFNYIFLNSYFFSFIVVILSIIFLAFLGDIIESYFKRLSNIKNSSNLIPGHGGFLDRFDSFILVTYGIFFYKFLII